MLVVQRTKKQTAVSWQAQHKDTLDLREGDRRELAALQPMHSCSVNCYRLLTADVWAVLQVTMLTFLLSLEIETWYNRKSTTHEK